MMNKTNIFYCLAGVVVCLALLACGGTYDEGETGTEAQGPPATQEQPEVRADRPATEDLKTVEVKLTEFGIDMPASLPPGKTSFRISNAGSAAHNFEIEGNGIEQKFDENLQPGETKALQINLRPGSYHIYCPVADHESKGMSLQLTVAPETTVK